MMIIHRNFLPFLLLSSRFVATNAFLPLVAERGRKSWFTRNSATGSRDSVTVTSQEEETVTAAAAAAAATTFTGAGPALVDMNAYNLPIEQIAEEWTADIVPQSAMQEEGIYLGAKSKKNVFVDSVKIENIPRRIGEGLGIELLEIAGGREDGLGITVVSGLVEGGICDGCGFLPGDCIVKISVVSSSTGNKNGKQEIATVATECLGYDATVEAITSLPPPSKDETISFTVKRLRRKPKVQINLQYPPSQQEPDITFELFSGENLRRALLVRGVKLNDPLSRRFDSGGTGDCGAEGTCATCAVHVLQGMELLNEPGTTEKQMLVKNPRWRMACKAIVGYGMKEGELSLRVNPRQWE